VKTLSYGDMLTFNQVVGEIYAARDMETFYQSVFASIQSIIPSEHSSFTDLNTQTHGVLKIVCNSDDHTTVVKQLAPVFHEHSLDHPLMPHCLSGDVVKVTDFVSKARFKNTAIHTDYYRHLGTDTQISFALPISQTKLSLLTLSRNSSDFSERDRLLLTLLRSHLITAMRNITELDQIRLERDILQRGERIDQKGSVLFEPDGIVICVTAFASELLTKYFGLTVAAGENIPGEIGQWIRSESEYARLHADKPAAGMSQSVDRKPFCIVRHDGCLTARLAQDVLTGDLMLFMSESSAPSVQLKKMEKFGLTLRETEVLYWLSKGKGNAEIAMLLHISKRTAEKHTERIFEKLGVESRAAASSILQKELPTLWFAGDGFDASK